MSNLNPPWFWHFSEVHKHPRITVWTLSCHQKLQWVHTKLLYMYNKKLKVYEIILNIFGVSCDSTLVVIKHYVNPLYELDFALCMHDGIPTLSLV